MDNFPLRIIQAVFVLSTSVSNAQTFTTVASFNGQNGKSPLNGRFYGTTSRMADPSMTATSSG
jgi:hypothetical protein